MADRTIAVHSPAHGGEVGRIPVLAEGEVAQLADRLRAAQPAWEDLGPAGRAEVLLRWADWMLDHERELGELVQQESGKAWGDASTEPTVSVQILKHYARHAAEYLAPRRVAPHDVTGRTRRLELRYRPYPLVGIITPWNGPLGAPVMDGVPALAAGAAVLSKPSEVAPLAWLEAVRGWREDVGGPEVLGCATGDGSTGAAVVDVVDMVMFTGSTRTGRHVAVRAAERLIPCGLELGGKDAMVVLADADLERASTAAVWGSMMNSGQLCISVERAYVEAPAYDEFVAKVTEKVAALRHGTDAPGAFTRDVGAMATADQVRIVERHVEDALANGARVTVGGRRGEAGLYFEPTVLADVDHSMICMREETFGPTIPIMRVADEEEAVRLANDSSYGLSASVWTGDEARGRRIAARLEAGSVDVNNALVHLFQFTLPQGGWKESGLGSRLGGAAGLLKYCRQQGVVSDRIALPKEPFWFPYGPRKNGAIARGARFLGARDWRRRLGLRPSRRRP